MERIPVIRTRNLSIGYVLKGGHLKLVHDALDLNLYPGEVTCLLGLNGAGKSTLLITTIGLTPASNAFLRTNLVCGIVPS